MNCPQHGTTPNPLCHVQQAGATFTGRVELRDGPDFGRVTGSWNEPMSLMDRIAGVAFFIGAAVIVAFMVWALLVIWLVRA